MKGQMTASSRWIIVAVVIGAAAVAFWMIALSPKREEATKLGVEVENLKASLSEHEADIAAGQEAKEGFRRLLQAAGRPRQGDAGRRRNRDRSWFRSTTSPKTRRSDSRT